MTDRPAHFSTTAHPPEVEAVDDDGNRRPRSSRRRRVLVVLLILTILAGGILGGSAWWVSRQVDPPGGPGAQQEIDVPVGATSRAIGSLLAKEGIIASGFVWEWYLRINGGGPFEAGIYELRTNSAMADVIDVLTAGPRSAEERSLTVPEGLMVSETLARLASTDKGLGFDPVVMAQLLADGEIVSSVLGAGLPSPEGILFPETYRVANDADAKVVLQQMVDLLDQTLTDLGVETAPSRLELSPYEILIVASLIEEESKVPAERPKVARVIYNRLRQGIPLGIDATSRYEAIMSGRSRDDIDFTSDSPYNTRKVAGLPPTPIASPGRESIEAALNPAEGPWTYYVLADSSGNHFFTDSYREFINAKNRCAAQGLGCG